MEKAKMKKRDQYRGKLLPNQIFKPMAFETLGGWVKVAVLFLKIITTIMARNQGKKESQVQKLLVEKNQHEHTALQCGMFCRQSQLHHRRGIGPPGVDTTGHTTLSNSQHLNM